MKREEQIKQAAIEDCGLYANNRGFNSFIAGAKWADEHPIIGWISVEEKVPNGYTTVLIANSTKHFIGLGFCIDNKWYYYDGNYCYMKNFITHWMPIPIIKDQENEKKD